MTGRASWLPGGLFAAAVIFTVILDSAWRSILGR